jgi:glycosylphosphatidylinositol phospholipase D
MNMIDTHDSIPCLLKAAGLACAVSLPWPATANAQITDPFPAEFDVSTLATGDGRLGLTISRLGPAESMDVVADMNGDGRSELVFGVVGFSLQRTYVVFGAASLGPSFDVRTLDGANGFRVDDSLEQSNFGASVAGLGDINGDGFGDVAVGAPGAYGGYGPYGPYGQEQSSTYVIYGRSSSFPASFNASSIGVSQPGAQLPANMDPVESGSGVAGVGDVNGDGLADLLVGAPGVDGGRFDRGQAFLVPGGFSGSRVFLESAASTVINGEGFGTGTGQRVAPVGDLNVDGRPDFAISSPSALSNDGRVHVVFGGTALPDSIDLDALSGDDGFEVPRAGGRNTNGAGPAGDVNGDGIDDLIVATNDDRAAVIFGRDGIAFPDSIDIASLNGSSGFVVEGTGVLVHGGGDVNGDGIDDIVVAERFGLMNGVVFGRSGGFPASMTLSELDGSNGFRIIGDGGVGVTEVRIVRDFNGDGTDDIAVLDTFGCSSICNAYVIFGREVEEPCRADLDGDGDLTLFDFLAFQNLFDTGDPIADFDGDGSLTLFDFLEFQNQFVAGCP